MVKKFTSYVIVGGTTFFIDAGITLGMVMFVHYIVANTLGFIVANIANFFLAHTWVFGGKQNRASLVRTYISVLVISLVGLVLSNLSMCLLIDHASMQLIPAKITTTLVVLVWNFFGRITFVYNKT